MPISLVQSKVGTPSDPGGATITVTFDSAVTPGNFITAWAGWDLTTREFQSASLGGAAGLLAREQQSGGVWQHAIAYAVASSSSQTASVTVTGSVSFAELVVAEWSAPGMAFSLTQTNEGTSVTSTNHDSGNVTTVRADAVLFGATNPEGGEAATVDTDFTFLRQGNGAYGGSIGYKVLTSAGTHSMTNTTTNPVNGITIIAAFSAAEVVYPHANFRKKPLRPRLFAPGHAR